jgi:hypothetical protein
MIQFESMNLYFADVLVFLFESVTEVIQFQMIEYPCPRVVTIWYFCGTSEQWHLIGNP